MSKLVKALKQCRGFQANALEIIRKHKFIFRGKGGRWEKLAFTFYTDLCEIHRICENALPVREVRQQEMNRKILVAEEDLVKREAKGFAAAREKAAGIAQSRNIDIAERIRGMTND